MVDLAGVDILTVLHALSDPVRLEIVRQLSMKCPDSDMPCGQITLPVGKSTATHHFKMLLSAGVIAERGEGTRKYLHLRKDELDKRFPGLIDSVLNAPAAS